MKTLLITDWAPNGTNDLLILNEECEVIASVEEATFGINVGAKAFELEPGSGWFVRETSLAEVIQHLAVSPVRTRAESYKRVMRALNGGAL